MKDIRYAILALIIISILLLAACDNKIEVTEQSLQGLWEQTNSKNRSIGGVNGILISKMDSSLFEEDVTISNKNNYSISSSGCFINLTQSSDKEKSLKYTCLSGELEYPIRMTKSTLTIGKRKFKKIYSEY